MGEKREYRKSSAVEVAEGALWGLGVVAICTLWLGFLIWADDVRLAFLPIVGFFVWAAVVVARDRMRRNRP